MRGHPALDPLGADGRGQADAKRVNTDPDFGRENFKALVRLVDRQDSGWRE